jgi:hypothetical protein
MITDFGSWVWLIVDVLFVLLLAAGLIYGTIMWRARRGRPVERHTEQATRQLYAREGEKERTAEAGRGSPVNTRIP